MAQAAWRAVQGCRNVSRRPAVVGALLEAVLQPRLFWRAGDEGSHRRALPLRPPEALSQPDTSHSRCQWGVQCWR